MCFGLGSIYGSNDSDNVGGRDSDYWEPSGPVSPIAPYKSPYQVVLDIPQEVDYGFHSTCQEDRQYEQDVGWNSGNYYNSYHWARYLDGNRPVPCSSIGFFDRLPHYRRDWWYRGLFKDGLTGAYERIGLSFFLGLIPVIGSIVCLFMSYVYVARPLSLARLRPEQLGKFKVAMWKLLAVDFFIGLIFPIGPFFRAWFHCNMRIIHFAYDAKNDHESYVDGLYYQNSGRIRVADLNKARAVDALKMYQQYHQGCIHTLYGADLLNAADRAVLEEDLARLQRELSQARTCQVRMENERIKSCNAAQPLIRRTMSNPEAPRCYHAIPPTTVWSDQGAGAGPSALSRGLAAQNKQFVPLQEPLVVQLAAVPQEQVPAAFQHLPAPRQPVVPCPAPSQAIAPHQVIVPQQATVPRQAIASQQPTPLLRVAPHCRNTPVLHQSSAPRSAMARPQRPPVIYQPMPPRRQALDLYANTSLPAMVQTQQPMYAPRQVAPRPYAQQQTMNPRQVGLVAQKAMAPPPPMRAIDTPVTFQQAIAAQQELSAVIPHQPPVPKQAVIPAQLLVLDRAVVPAQSLVVELAFVPVQPLALQQAGVPEQTTTLEQVVVPGQTVFLAQTVLPLQTSALVDPTVGTVPALASASPIDCAVATLLRPDSNVLETAPVSPSTIQAYMDLMQQRTVQVERLNLSSVAPTSTRRKRSSTPAMLRNFCIGPSRVPPTMNGPNPNPNGETAPTTPTQAAELSSSRPLALADQVFPHEQHQTAKHNLQASDIHSLSSIVAETSGLHQFISDELQVEQDVLLNNHDRPLDDAGLSGHAYNSLAGHQMSSSLESDVTATEPKEQAIWKVQSDSEDVYGDDEAEDEDESSDDDDSEDEGREGGDGEGDEKGEDESGGDSGDQDEGDDDDDSEDASDYNDDEDDDGDDESTDSCSTQENDYTESDIEMHYQILVTNFNIAMSLNQTNNRPMSRLSTLLALESSAFSESNLASRRQSGHQHCYGPSSGPSVSTLFASSVGSSNGGRVPVLGVSAEHNPEHNVDTPLGMPHSDSEASSLEEAIEEVLSRRWKIENRNKQPQRLIRGPRFDID
ncbi:hypothetical protein BG006_005976 [Podila minutissima]|uniref:Uncharacterized protein n=1 Tax=Podila minutissima TaxID=64525 RepID=A0A9P5SMA6_9FUNG|nr:hypothetical protein BG006_005976 [Podila minutissima]